MKIYSINIIRREPNPAKILAAEYDLSQFSFFQRSTHQEFMAFFACTLAERTAPGVRQSVSQDQYVGFVYTGLSGLTGVMIVDHEYPQRVAFTLLNRILDEFGSKYRREEWLSLGNKASTLPYPELKATLQKYQNPSEADAIMRVQRELDETKVVLHETVNSLLKRGETLEQLVSRSDQLTEQSKTFYKAAKKTNSCCIIQ